MAKIISKTADELINDFWEEELNHSRNVRSDLLKAFDAYNSNKISGFSKNTYSLEEEEKLRDWYFRVLDLEYNAIFIEESIPEQIKYFLPKDYFNQR